MLKRLRWLSKKTFTPLASVLLRAGVSPDAITICGALGVVIAALWLFPTGHLFAGTWVITGFVFADALDGTMARLAGRSGVWGAFLDSTLDRIADAAIFSGLVIYLMRAEHFGLGMNVARWAQIAGIACLALGAVVPYARARAEGLGMTATVGIAERADRLVATLIGALAVGLGAPLMVLAIILTLLALASAITIVQRMVVVRRQAFAAPSSVAPSGDAPPGPTAASGTPDETRTRDQGDA